MDVTIVVDDSCSRSSNRKRSNNDYGNDRCVVGSSSLHTKQTMESSTDHSNIPYSNSSNNPKTERQMKRCVADYDIDDHEDYCEYEYEEEILMDDEDVEEIVLDDEYDDEEYVIEEEIVFETDDEDDGVLDEQDTGTVSSKDDQSSMDVEILVDDHGDDDNNNGSSAVANKSRRHDNHNGQGLGRGGGDSSSQSASFFDDSTAPPPTIQSDESFFFDFAGNGSKANDSSDHIVNDEHDDDDENDDKRSIDIYDDSDNDNDSSSQNDNTSHRSMDKQSSEKRKRSVSSSAASRRTRSPRRSKSEKDRERQRELEMHQSAMDLGARQAMIEEMEREEALRRKSVATSMIQSINNIELDRHEQQQPPPSQSILLSPKAVEILRSSSCSSNTPSANDFAHAKHRLSEEIQKVKSVLSSPMTPLVGRRPSSSFPHQQQVDTSNRKKDALAELKRTTARDALRRNNELMKELLISPSQMDNNACIGATKTANTERSGEVSPPSPPPPPPPVVLSDSEKPRRSSISPATSPKYYTPSSEKKPSLRNIGVTLTPVDKEQLSVDLCSGTGDSESCPSDIDPPSPNDHQRRSAKEEPIAVSIDQLVKSMPPRSPITKKTATTASHSDESKTTKTSLSTFVDSPVMTPKSLSGRRNYVSTVVGMTSKILPLAQQESNRSLVYSSKPPTSPVKKQPEPGWKSFSPRNATPLRTPRKLGSLCPPISPPPPSAPSSACPSPLSTVSKKLTLSSMHSQSSRKSLVTSPLKRSLIERFENPSGSPTKNVKPPPLSPGRLPTSATSSPVGRSTLHRSFGNSFGNSSPVNAVPAAFRFQKTKSKTSITTSNTSPPKVLPMSKIDNDDAKQSPASICASKGGDDETTNCYSLSQLQKKTVDGIDMTKREQCLSSKDFEALFHMSKEDFGCLPKWKRDKAKRSVGLF